MSYRYKFEIFGVIKIKFKVNVSQWAYFKVFDD